MVIYPFMFYWIIIYPLGCLTYLIKNKSKLESVEIRAKFGFFINGYKNNLYFWYLKFVFLHYKIN